MRINHTKLVLQLVDIRDGDQPHEAFQAICKTLIGVVLERAEGARGLGERLDHHLEKLVEELGAVEADAQPEPAEQLALDAPKKSTSKAS